MQQGSGLWGRRLTTAAACVLVTAPGFAQGQKKGGDIIVTAPGADLDQGPAATVDSKAIEATGTPELLPALSRTIAGVSLQDAQNNPFQPNLVYHGYVASPLQGTAQGLAFYVDGARFNQPFGDTVNFDLLPDAAIDTITLRDADPVYGLNALGGAVVVATRTGRSFPGLSVTGAAGSDGWAEGALQAGWRTGHWSGYVALQARHDGGWRRFSPSTLYNGYADLGYDGASAGAHLKLIGADSDLTGNGSSPVELLAADRRAVFTHPDNSRNRFGRVSLHPWLTLSDATRVEGSFYLQHLRQNTVNGDAADIEPCDDDDMLCLESAGNEQAPLVDTTAKTVPALLDDDDAYGVLNRSDTRTGAGGGLVQLIDSRPLWGGSNRLAVGASYDASRTSFRSSTELGALTATRGVDGLGPIIAQPDGSITPVSLKARTRYAGLFLSERLPLAARLSAEVGLRYNSARILLDDRIGTDLNGRHRFARLNPGVALVNKVSEALTLKASYTETNRAPTAAELSCAGPDDPCSFANFFVGDPPLKQVVAKSWQAGGSGRWVVGGWHVDWRLLGYRSTNHDDIQFVAADVRGRAYFRNVGQTRRQGLEADVSLVRGRWSGRVGYALTDATFRNALVLNSPDNPSADDEGTIAVARGDRLPGIPRHRAIASIDYVGDRFTLGGDVQVQSGQFLVGDEANLEAPTNSFAVANLRGSVKLAGPCWAFVEVTNLFNSDYASFGTFTETGDTYLAEAPGAQDPRSLGPGAPRRWKVGARVAF